MIYKFSKSGLGLAASIVLLTGSGAFAADSGFLNCGSGGAVKDSWGNCLLSAGGAALPECLPEVAMAPAPIAPPPLPAPMPAPTPLMQISLAADTTFDFDRAELKPEGRARLDQLANDMQGVDVTGVDVVGHTDSKGSEAYNQSLSERRASSAANYLVGRGVDAGLISARGAGELQPIAPNTKPNGRDNPEGRALNRRVDIVVEGNKAQ